MTEAQRRAAAAATAALAASATTGLSSGAAKAEPAPAATPILVVATPAAPPIETPADPQASLPPDERVHYGAYDCEGRQQLQVERDQGNPGHARVRHRTQTWLMRISGTESGSIRLEDVKGQALLLQIPVKSMLMNTRTGQRMLDGCQHALQKAASSEAPASLTLLK
jgi:hypothetical protein